MNYLFFIVHPSKYHLFKNVINKLLENGNKVDILIISKGRLEELVKLEKWNYTNIFPGGRRIKGLNTRLSSILYLFVTLFKLIKRTGRNKHHLYITDDLLTIIGRIRKVPTLLFTDDDIKAVPESVILIKTASYIVSPDAASMGKYEFKKIGYYGFKSLAHLHPLRFIPDRSLLGEKTRSEDIYFFIRCVSATSTHDIGKKGITDILLVKLVRFLEKHGSVIINSERVLPPELEQCRIIFQDDTAAHYLAYAKIFISDSTTMCAEAAVLGTPSIEIDDWYSDFGQYKLLNKKYGLVWGFKPDNENGIFEKISEILNSENSRIEYQNKKNKMIEESIDVSSFIYWLLSEYPSSVEEYLRNRDVQLRFR